MKMLLSIACVLTALSGRSVAAEAKPNVVFILADDLGYGDARCYNPQSKIATPHIDRLAADGLRFTDAHSPSAVCTPTRYGLLTGRYSWRTRLQQGVLQGYDPLLIERGRKTIADVLRAQGYATACIGKWHLGFGIDKPVDYAKPLAPGPNAVGFDTFFGIPSSLDFTPYVFVENERATALPTLQIGDSKHQRDGGDGFWRGGAIAPGFSHAAVLPTLTDKAVEFINKQSSSRPFFLYFALSGPHTPWLPTKEFQGKSGAGVYGDFVMQSDASIGRVLAALDERKLRDNTLVIVTSDNGSHWPLADVKRFDHAGNGPWRGQKGDIHEGGHRVPLIVRWPGKSPAGKTTDALICHTDWFATLATAAGTTPPSDAAEDSVNQLSIIRGEQPARPPRESIVLHSTNGLFAIRRGSWKLIAGLGSGGFTAPNHVKPKPGGPQGQLYNLAKDPAETTNRWLDEPARVKELSELLETVRRGSGDSARPTR